MCLLFNNNPHPCYSTKVFFYQTQNTALTCSSETVKKYLNLFLVHLILSCSFPGSLDPEYLSTGYFTLISVSYTLRLSVGFCIKLNTNC